MTSRSSYDVVIVGAGPAGSSAAYELARSGVRVALLEKSPMPRYKACGGGLVYRVLKLLPFDVSEVIERECRVAQLNLHDAGLYFSVKREYPLVSMTMREKFDYLLSRAARVAGADVREGWRVLDIVPRNGKMEVVTDKTVLLSRFVIGADGVTSIVARKGGWQEKGYVAPLVEWEIRVKEDVFDAFAEAARFEFGPLRSGYAWVFPKREHLSVGIGTVGSERVNLRKTLQDFLVSLGIDAIDHIEHHGYFIPRRLRKEGFVKGRILLVGDAAGFVDPVTGEGITYAILSGQSAARALITGGFADADVKDAYYSELRVGVLRELRWGNLLAALLYRSPRTRARLFKHFGSRLTEAIADILTGEKTYAELCRKDFGFRRLLGTLSPLSWH